MENFNKQNGSNLVAIGKTILVRMGLYSNSVHSVQDVPEGATVSIPNDPTNGGRALALLAKAGLITLKMVSASKQLLQISHLTRKI